MFEEISKWYLKIIYFFIANQIAFKRGLVVLLILLNAVIWTLGFVKWTNYLTTLKAHNYEISILSKNLVNFEEYKQTHKPNEIEIILEEVVVSENGKYDFFAKIKNPNDKWAVSMIKYRFLYNGGVTQEKVDFIMPKQEKYLFAFLQEVNNKPEDIKLDILDVIWGRIKNSDYLEILSNITFQDENFSRINGTSQVNFSVENKTPYNFWAVGFQVALYQGGRLAAVNYVPVNNFLSLSKKEVQASWFGYIPNPDRIEILSDVNYLQDVFMEAEDLPGVPKGVE